MFGGWEAGSGGTGGEKSQKGWIWQLWFMLDLSPSILNTPASFSFTRIKMGLSLYQDNSPSSSASCIGEWLTRFLREQHVLP